MKLPIANLRERDCAVALSSVYSNPTLSTNHYYKINTCPFTALEISVSLVFGWPKSEHNFRPDTILLNQEFFFAFTLNFSSFPSNNAMRQTKNLFCFYFKALHPLFKILPTLLVLGREYHINFFEWSLSAWICIHDKTKWSSQALRSSQSVTCVVYNLEVAFNLETNLQIGESKIILHHFNF